MSRKTSSARRAAFFDALRATGNQTLAAERAKVSRSWVQLQRSGDPAFDDACKSAIAAAKASFDKLRMNGTMMPPPGWGFLDGEELVVRGSGGSGGGRRVQIARARLHQWTPRIEDRFLATLGATCNVKAACAEVGMSAASAYEHRERWPGFAKRWDKAVELADIRLSFALVEHAGNPFSSLGPPEPVPIPPMTVDDALHNLYMHQHRLRGTGGRPGRSRRPPSVAEAIRVISSKIDAIERGSALSEADKARDREEYALRRQASAGGQAAMGNGYWSISSAAGASRSASVSGRTARRGFGESRRETRTIAPAPR